MSRWLLLLVLLSAGCSSRSKLLYEEGDPPRLKDGTITVKTSWGVGEEASQDTRRIRCRDGRVTAELVSHARGHFIGEVPVARWEKIWSKMLQTRPFTKKKMYGVEPDDAQAQGPYHLISMEVGGHFHQFSAQLRRNVLGVFSTGDVADRLAYSDAVADLVSEYARRELKADK